MDRKLDTTQQRQELFKKGLKMPYTVDTFNQVQVEEFITGWILRLTFPEGTFKFYAHSHGENDVVIYIGHGTVTTDMKRAIREWASKRGIKRINWGREKQINKAAKV